MADDEFFYVAASDGIYRGSIDTDSGKLGTLALACAVKNPNFVALAPDGKSLYATCDDFIACFTVGSNGVLTAQSQMPLPGMGPCHVSVDSSGHDVLVANYNGGSVGCFRREADGSLGEETSHHAYVSSGPDKARQTSSHAHSIYPDPEDKFVYVCDLGGDDVWIYKFDAVQGTLRPSASLLAKVPPGSGPRHLAFHPNGRFVYIANEMGHSVTAFSRDAASGALTTIETVSTLSPGISAQGVTTAEIVCHPSGKWLYVSNRGCETISVFSISVDGRLDLIQSVPCIAQLPRNFALDPTGRWLIVAGQKGNQLAVLKINPLTGQLTATDQVAAVKAPMRVLFSRSSR